MLFFVLSYVTVLPFQYQQYATAPGGVYWSPSPHGGCYGRRSCPSPRGNDAPAHGRAPSPLSHAVDAPHEHPQGPDDVPWSQVTPVTQSCNQS